MSILISSRHLFVHFGLPFSIKGLPFKKIIFQLFKELQDRKVVDNFNVTSVHYLLDKICINTNYLEVICFKNLSQSTLFYLSRSPSSMKAINCHSLIPKTTLKC